MAVRRRPRYRYVVFRLDSESSLSEKTVTELVLAATDEYPTRLVQFDGGRGILRCVHTDKDAVIAALNSSHETGRFAVRITTIGTSGTIRRARAKFLG